MSTSEKKETLRKIVESGKSKGSLSNREIMDTLADVSISPEQLEKLYDKLEANGIEIVEDSLDDVILPPIMKGVIACFRRNLSMKSRKETT